MKAMTEAGLVGRVGVWGAPAHKMFSQSHRVSTERSRVTNSFTQQVSARLFINEVMNLKFPQVSKFTSR